MIITDGFSFILDESDDESDDATIKGVGRGKKKNLWPINKDSNGKPMLPEFDENEEPSLVDKKNILHSFFTSSYRMFYFIFALYC